MLFNQKLGVGIMLSFWLCVNWKSELSDSVDFDIYRLI